MAWTKEYQYKAFRAWLGPQLFVFLTNPEDIEVTNKNLGKTLSAMSFKNVSVNSI